MKETLPWRAKKGGTMQVIIREMPCMEPTMTAASTADRAAEDFIVRWDLAMAGNVILMAPLLLLYIFCNKQMKVAFIGNGIK